MRQNPPLRLAINGYGRIGRCFLRALRESSVPHILQVVAINEPANLESMAYLTRFDSTHGRFPGQVEVGATALVIDGQTIAVSHARTPETVDWRALDIDLLIESSGCYGQRAELARFLTAGAPRLLLSHPGFSASDVDATIVNGINQHIKPGEKVVVEGLINAREGQKAKVVPAGSKPADDAKTGAPGGGK